MSKSKNINFNNWFKGNLEGIFTSDLNSLLSFKDKFSSGEAVVAKADVSSYQGRLQLDIKKIGRASVQTHGRYGFDPTLIVPSSEKDPMEMWQELQKFVKRIKNQKLKIIT